MAPEHTVSLEFRNSMLYFPPPQASTGLDEEKTGQEFCTVQEQLLSDMGSRSESAHNLPSQISV